MIIMICTCRNDYLTQSHEGACTLEKEQASLVQVQTGGCSSSAGNTVVMYSRWKIKAEVPSVVQIHMEVHTYEYVQCVLDNLTSLNIIAASSTEVALVWGFCCVCWLLFC